MYLRRLHLQDFINPKESISSYPEMPTALLVCCACESDDPKAIAPLLNVVRSMSKIDKAGFSRGMTTILKLANKGMLPSEHFSVEACHNDHTFTFNGETRKIKGVRTSDIRVLYFDANDRILLVTSAFPKHKKKITNAQKQEAEDVVKAYLGATQRIIVNRMWI